MYYHRQVNRRPRGKHFSKDSLERTFSNIFNTKAGPEINQVTVICTGKGCACWLQLWHHVTGSHWLFQQSSASPHKQCWPSGSCGGSLVQVREVMLTDTWTLAQGSGLYKQPSQTCHITMLRSFTSPLSVRPWSWQHTFPESSSPRSWLITTAASTAEDVVPLLSRAPAPGIQKYVLIPRGLFTGWEETSQPQTCGPCISPSTQAQPCKVDAPDIHTFWKPKTVSQQDILVPPQNLLKSAGLAKKLLSSELSWDPQ